MINKSTSHLVLAKKLRDRIKFVPNIYSQNVLLSIVEFYSSQALTVADFRPDSNITIRVVVSECPRLTLSLDRLDFLNIYVINFHVQCVLTSLDIKCPVEIVNNSRM